MAKARGPKDSTGTATDIAADQQDERAQGHSPEQIAARAYELYLARGGAHGQDWDDWLAAERELASAATPRSERTE